MRHVYLSVAVLEMIEILFMIDNSSKMNTYNAYKDSVFCTQFP